MRRPFLFFCCVNFQSFMDRIDLLVEALRNKFEHKYDLEDYLEAGTPFGGKGVVIWLQYKQGTTTN